ncbi:hypothetical protein 2018Mat004_0080 [Vibrio phage ICP1]|nr:hypothetical protein 2018Mat001_0080 [Vibrio phage ICP1]QVW04960.1 hypothetical protein 2018Mat004_0080 [Vibrio phage ICP1]QVW07643.1 hypothetical protein 2019Mat005_0080 [Vibrio phage ICP1]QVW08093.1 hypothetical protein 2019MatC_0080 [Vibrio phage ICP1]
MQTTANYFCSFQKVKPYKPTLSFGEEYQQAEERSRKKGKIDRRKARDNKRNWMIAEIG